MGCLREEIANRLISKMHSLCMLGHTECHKCRNCTLPGNSMQEKSTGEDHISVTGIAMIIIVYEFHVKWYLDHGLHMTKIYQVIEFSPHSCFRDFRENVSGARRKGNENHKYCCWGHHEIAR